MTTLTDKATAAKYARGYIILQMESGIQVRFPVKGNPRLERGSPRQLNNIEISPFGLHWPDLDEDLSFAGLLAGDYGQRSSRRTKACGGRAHARR